MAKRDGWDTAAPAERTHGIDHDAQHQRAPARRLVYHRQCGQWGGHPIPLAWHPHQALLATGSTLDYTRLHDVTIWTPNGILHTHIARIPGLWQVGWS
jgi:hypothetical protein